jgi:hypothetical protein
MVSLENISRRNSLADGWRFVRIREKKKSKGEPDDCKTTK